MLYEVGMLCKHFKGANLYEKNIYRIERLNVKGTDIDTDVITYSGDGNLNEAESLIVYANVFQNNKLFTREYEDLASPLTEEKQKQFNQKYRVQPLTEEEIKIVNTSDFKEKKEEYILKKYNN